MTRKPIPTLGFPSQQAAVLALYEQGIAPSVIARQTGASINAVTRSISTRRRKTGVSVPVTAPASKSRKGDPRMKQGGGRDWQMRNYLRSIRGARQALEALGQ